MANGVTTGRKNLPAEKRRAVILEAAREIFLRSGFGGATTKDIAAAAGCNISVLYKHFASKDELFEASVLEPLEAMLADLATRGPQLRGLSASERMDVMRHGQQVLFTETQKMLPLLGTALFSDWDSGRRFYQERLVPLLEEGYRAMADSLEGWPHRPADPRDLFTALWGMHLAFAMDHAFREQDPDPGHVAEVVADFAAARVRLQDRPRQD